MSGIEFELVIILFVFLFAGSLIFLLNPKSFRERCCLCLVWVLMIMWMVSAKILSERNIDIEIYTLKVSTILKEDGVKMQIVWWDNKLVDLNTKLKGFVEEDSHINLCIYKYRALGINFGDKYVYKIKSL